MVELKCIVHQAKPKAQIVWFRENAEFYSGKFNFLNDLSPEGSCALQERINYMLSEKEGIFPRVLTQFGHFLSLLGSNLFVLFGS